MDWSTSRVLSALVPPPGVRKAGLRGSPGSIRGAGIGEHLAALLLLVLLGLAAAGCGNDNGSGGSSFDAGPSPRIESGWPEANEWSWNGLWQPNFPLEDLLDDQYNDGHKGSDGMPTPILPPGEWDYTPDNAELANWRNFHGNIGNWVSISDSMARPFGWRLDPIQPGAVDYQGPAAYFEGSGGVDWLSLGAAGQVHSFGDGNLRGGPDVLVFDRSYALDFRTGSSDAPGQSDDDLVVMGCKNRPDGSFGIDTTTIHTGPGHDWVFARNISRTAVDLGNGASGRTDSLDNGDGDDLVVLGGNTHDFRVYGGKGDDTAVWFIDENVQTERWLGPNFFGGGGAGDALFGDDGTDRLVLAIPTDTQLVTTTPTPAGGLLTKQTDGGFIVDEPTVGDPFAVYCVECGEGPGGRRTVIFEYNSANGKIETGYFYVTAFEEIQVGLGDGARVYRIDDVNGTIEPLPNATPTTVPALPGAFCDGSTSP
ncbi:MAG: hypothetical protein R3A78_05660 [Polyangiales bacterium]|nr:hypothetical protein [Myxococcales bacterium]